MTAMKLYRDYWKHQAKAHPTLAHTDAARVFQVITIEQALGDYRVGVQAQGWIFRLIEPTYRILLDDSGRYRKYMQGGYVVAKWIDFRAADEDTRHQIVDQVEQVNDDLIAKMIADSMNDFPLFNHSLDSNQQISSELVPITGDASYIGIRTIYSWDTGFVNCLLPLEEEGWADEGVTPYPIP